MKTRSRILRIALAVAVALTCEAGTIADQVVTTSSDEVAFTSARDSINCNQATCTQTCDRTAPSTGHCVNRPAHIVMITT